ncbi:MAG TPA: hypothetical protein VN836_04750 [Verrucomicrobiae bacterium]|nr:hypothetical protein [Verrucomicrobiae bacterium]
MSATRFAATIASVPATFEAACHVAQLYVAFRRVKQLVADFPANEKFHLSPAYHCNTLAPAEIKIVEGQAKETQAE